jgi:hypothetical protein
MGRHRLIGRIRAGTEADTVRSKTPWIYLVAQLKKRSYERPQSPKEHTSMLSTAESVSTIQGAHDTDAESPAQALDRFWTRPQLQAAAEMDKKVQRHPQHMLARVALANYGSSLDLERIRTSVAQTLGGTAGTYYIVAALHLAHLARTFPQTLSATQRALLLAPLEAAEMLREVAHNASPMAQVAA